MKLKGNKPMSNVERKRIWRAKQKAKLSNAVTKLDKHIPQKSKAVKHKVEKPKVTDKPVEGKPTVDDKVIKEPVRRLLKKQEDELLFNLSLARIKCLEYEKKHKEDIEKGKEQLPNLDDTKWLDEFTPSEEAIREHQQELQRRWDEMEKEKERVN